MITKDIEVVCIPCVKLFAEVSVFQGNQVWFIGDVCDICGEEKGVTWSDTFGLTTMLVDEGRGRIDNVG